MRTIWMRTGCPSALHIAANSSSAIFVMGTISAAFGAAAATGFLVDLIAIRHSTNNEIVSVRMPVKVVLSNVRRRPPEAAHDVRLPARRHLSIAVERRHDDVAAIKAARRG